MNFYEYLGLPRTAGQADIEAAFTNWNRTFSSAMQTEETIDVYSANLVCNAYRALSQPKYRQKYDELLIWLDDPTIENAISNEEFTSWLRPGTSIETEMRLRLAAEEKAAHSFRGVMIALLDRVASCRGPWVGLSCWLFTWVLGITVLATTFRSLYWVLTFALKAHR